MPDPGSARRDNQVSVAYEPESVVGNPFTKVASIAMPSVAMYHQGVSSAIEE